MKILICGGHLSPAIAFIDELPKDLNIVFVGRRYAFEKEKTLSLEFRTIKEKNIPFYNLTTGRLQRKFTFGSFLSLFKIPIGFFQALKIISQERPDIVVGFGGYVSLPICLASHLMGIPIVIHEQTQEAGFSNKIISTFARKVCISWVNSRKFFPEKKTVLTGNLIRKEDFLKPLAPFKFKEKLPILYITGGETGSHFINQLVLGSLATLLSKFNVFHQVGESSHHSDYEYLIKEKNNLSKELRNRYSPVKFLSPRESVSAIKEADLIVGRSGINTVSEVAFFGKPAIFIPIYFSQRNEQEKNALLLKNIGTSEILEQRQLTPKKFIESINYVISNLEKYKSHAQEAKKLVNIHAAAIFAKVVLDEAKKKQ